MNAQREAPRSRNELDTVEVPEAGAARNCKSWWTWTRAAEPRVNEGFSGGEKKRNEIFQMALLEPTLAILDETDSGLDIDACRLVPTGVNRLRSPDRSIVLVTHYQRHARIHRSRIVVHVLSDGKHRALR